MDNGPIHPVEDFVENPGATGYSPDRHKATRKGLSHADDVWLHVKMLYRPPFAGAS